MRLLKLTMLISLFLSEAFADGNLIIFESKKSIKFFDEPILSKCLLATDSSGKLRWQTLEPFESAMIYDGKNASAFECEDGVWRKISIPQDSLIKVLRGLRSAISDETKIPTDIFDYNKNSDGVIELTPKESHLKLAIKKIRLKFKEDGKTPIFVEIIDSANDKTFLKTLRAEIPSKNLKDAFNVENAGAFKFLGEVM